MPGPNLEGHAHEQSRLYQNSGTQNNTHNAFYNVLPQSDSLWPEAADWSVVSESDPLDLGVHRAALEDGTHLTRYTARDIDPEIRKALGRICADGGLCLIVGDSTAGKTRSAFEAARDVCPDRLLFVPDNMADLRSGLVKLLGAPPALVLLDDLQRFLHSTGMQPSLIRNLKANKIPVSATIRSEQYRRFLPSASAEDIHGDHDEIFTNAILRMTQPIHLPRKWTPSEVDRARASSDGRVNAAASTQSSFGIAEYVAAGPQIISEWRIAADSTSGRRAAAILSAAVDCARAGLSPVSREYLQRVHHSYIDSTDPTTNNLLDFTESLDWATTIRFGTTAPLRLDSAGEGYIVFDYLIDEVDKSQDAEIPSHVWQSVIEEASDQPRTLIQIANAAMSHDQTEVALSALRLAAEEGDIRAAGRFGSLLRLDGQIDEAAKWLKTAAENGDLSASTRLGLLEEERDQLDEAERWYSLAADVGDLHAAAHYGGLLRRRGKYDEAETYLRSAYQKDDFATPGLGLLLNEIGKTEEAESLLRDAIEQGRQYAANALGMIYAETNRLEEACGAWFKALETDHDPAIPSNLALALAQLRRFDEADEWAAVARDANREDFDARFGLALIRGGRKRDGEALLRAAADQGQGLANLFLADFLVQQNRIEEAEPWAHAAVEANQRGARSCLGKILIELDRTDEAIEVWRLAVTEGETESTGHLAEALARVGKLEEAEPLLLAIVDSDDGSAACVLGDISQARNQPAESINWLTKSVSMGHVHAYCSLGGRLASNGDVLGAERAFRSAYEGGHHHAAERLVRLYKDLGRMKDAAYWLRVETGQLDPAKNKGDAQRRGKKSKRNKKNSGGRKR